MAVGDTSGVLRELADAEAAVASVYLYFDEAVFRAAPRLKVVGRVGVGVDNIDLEAATRSRVRVVNTPEPIIEPVAEHALMLALAAVRRMVAGDRNMRAGKFRIPSDLPGFELRGKTLGLVGFGNTGRRFAEIAHLGLLMKILYHDLRAFPEAEERLGARRRDFEALLRESDIVSVHVNLSPSTRGLFSEKAFRLMKPSAYFINCARGAMVDESALFKAVKEGWIAGAGLDVYAEEPPPADHPLFALDNVVITPHRAGHSIESRRGCSMVVEDVVRVLRGEKPRFPVN